MRQASLIIGIIVIIGMCIGFIPCLGWFNWLNLPVAFVGIILGAIDYNDQRNLQYKEYDTYNRPGMPLGLILCCVAFILGFIRLIIGFGIF